MDLFGRQRRRLEALQRWAAARLMPVVLSGSPE
jgi:hypothetical protein